MIIPQNPETGEMRDKPRGPNALRRAADVWEACAVGDDTDAWLVLVARALERKALGTLQGDEWGALVRLG